MSNDFNALSETEQREVAERLLKIAESGWKPFWCPDVTCNGDPHWLEVDEGSGPENLWVDVQDIAGPNGEPVGDIWYEDQNGNLFSPEPGEPVEKWAICLGRPVLDPMWSHNHARVDQRLPSWLKPWVLFIMSGRGAGKTTTGSEFVTLCARKGLDGAIVGRRGTELVNTHVATIIARAHPEFKPIHWASKDILEWPNGAITYLFSAEKPENIRSVNLSYAWVDEAAFMDEIETAWMNLKLATRIEKPGNPLHMLITSTPTSTPWVMEMEDDPDVEIRRVSTYANKANLSAKFLADMRKKYEGTRMGRQELYGEVLRDVEGSLWNEDMFRNIHIRLDGPEFVDFVEGLDDIVLAIDPAGSKGKRSDATGIIGMGAHHFGDNGQRLSRSNLYVLCDATLKGSPTEWAEQAFVAARLIHARTIVAEKNFGGDMVKQVLMDYAALHPEKSKTHDGGDFRIVVRRAIKSKETRAEGTVGKYEQGIVHHVVSPMKFGDLSALEKEQVNWVPKSRGGKFPSPNRIDALVWADRELDTAVRYEASTAGRDVLKKLKRPGAA